MIQVRTNSTSFDSNVFFSTYFQGKRSYLVLLTHTTTSSEVWDPINSFLTNEIISQNWEDIPLAHLEETLRDLFNELNWKLLARLRPTNLPEKGLSLYLVLVYDQQIFAVQFGRLLSCIISPKSIDIFGREWENFHVKTKDELFLLGAREENIHVKVLQTTLLPHQSLIVLPSSEAMEYMGNEPSHHDFVEPLLKRYLVHRFPFVILSAIAKTKVKKPPLFRGKPFRISAVLALILISIAVSYMYWGNNCIQDLLNRLKLQVRHNNTIELKNVIKSAPPQIEKQLKQIEHVVLAPAKSITIRENLLFVSDIAFTAKPTWDVDHLYLISHKRLIALDKHTKKIAWEKWFANELLLIKKVNQNDLLVVEKGNRVVQFNSKGELLWENTKAKYGSVVPDREEFQNPVELTYTEDARLSGSILVFPLENVMRVTNAQDGTDMSQCSLAGDIDYLSDYDQSEHCFYVISGLEVYKVILDIRNW